MIQLGRNDRCASAITATDAGAPETGTAVKPSQPTAGMVGGTRSIEVDRAEFLQMVREATSVGASLWIRTRGGSMMPAIPRGAMVRVRPLVGVPRRGDVVLATLPNGQPVLHRVRRVEKGRVFLKGDNLVLADTGTPLDRVYALADALDMGAGIVKLSARPRHSLRLALARWRWHFWRRLTHV
jgi:hypothetical protein